MVKSHTTGGKAAAFMAGEKYYLSENRPHIWVVKQPTPGGQTAAIMAGEKCDSTENRPHRGGKTSAI